MESEKARVFRCRITGPQSIDRLDPLIRNLLEVNNISKISSSNTCEYYDYIWETTCERNMREKHKQATVLNKLHNTVVIESKSNQAFLQLNMQCPVLETLIACGMTSVCNWCTDRWLTGKKGAAKEVSSDWWVLKASHGNGGKDIWLLNCSNFKSVLAELTANEEYVIQKYIMRPKLLNGKKFHFRCYSLLRADFSCFVYQKAFLLTAGVEYDPSSECTNSHITNLSINKAFKDHPGQIPCDLQAEYPVVCIV